MFSIHKQQRGLLAAVLLATVGLAGCQRAFRPEVAKLSVSPLKIDGAIKHRRWDQTSVSYANGSVPAWTTGFKLESKPDMDWWMYHVMTPTMFVGQVVAFPVVYATDHPTQLRAYRGIIIPPSWHAMPPLDPVP